MAKFDAKVELDVSGLDKVQTLICLLESHMSELPVAVISGLKELADCAECEMGIESIVRMGFKSAKVIVDGEELKSTVSVNKILKRVTRFGAPCLYPEHASLVSDTGVVIAEW